MIKSRKLITLALICMVILLSSALVSAASYVGYLLPRFQVNNYTGSHEKQTNNQYITNRVTNLQNADSVNMWATNNSKSAISEKINFRKGSGYKNINFRSNQSQYKGQYVRMGMENGNFQITDGFVAGDVNFQ